MQRGKQYFVLGWLQQPRQDKNLLSRHEELNEATKEGPLSYVLHAVFRIHRSTCCWTSGSISQMCGSGSGSFVIKLLFCEFFWTFMLQKEISRKTFFKLVFLASWRSMTKIAGSWSESGFTPKCRGSRTLAPRVPHLPQFQQSAGFSEQKRRVLPVQWELRRRGRPQSRR